MSYDRKDAFALACALDLPISTCHYPNGEVDLFVHTDPKSLDKNLSSLERAGYQALELAKHQARRRKDGDNNGGTRIRPKNPVLTG